MDNALVTANEVTNALDSIEKKLIEAAEKKLIFLMLRFLLHWQFYF